MTPILSGMETVDRKQGVGLNGPEFAREIQRRPIREVLQSGAFMRTRRPKRTPYRAKYHHHA